MGFVIGFIGAISVLMVFAAGVFLGWKIKARDIEMRQRVTAEKLTEDQRRKIADEQEAWRELNNYNQETAYGMNRTEPRKEN